MNEAGQRSVFVFDLMLNICMSYREKFKITAVTSTKKVKFYRVFVCLSVC